MVTDAKEAPKEVTVEDDNNPVVVDGPSRDAEPKPSAEPETLTREQAEKLANERHSKLDKRIVELEKLTIRHATATKAAEDRAKALEQKALEAERKAEEAERNALMDDPDALSLFEKKAQHKQAVAQLEADRKRHAEERVEWAADVAEAKAYKTQKLADDIAAEHGVDSATLVSLTDGSRDKMEKLAKVLPKKGVELPGPNLQKPPKPDSGKRSAAHGPYTMAQLENMTMDQYADYVKERDAK